MSNIRSVFIKNVGWVITELDESLSGLMTLTNPCIISGDSTGVTFIPMLHLVQETSMTLTKDDIVGNVFTPVEEYTNAYAQQFGKLVVPEKKIILQ